MMFPWEPQAMARSRAQIGPRTGGTLLAGELTLAAVCCLAVTIIWAATGGPFWPMWVWTSLGLSIALQIAWRRAWAEPRGPRRRLAVQGSISVVLAGYLVLVWAMGGLGYFWPVFPAVGLAMAFALHAVFHSSHQTDLSARVDELTRTRRGALDIQSAELRRIERDLHDGAQARLVALTMQLGRAEARLEDQPETADADPPGAGGGHRCGRRVARSRARDRAAGAGRPRAGRRRRGAGRTVRDRHDRRESAHRPPGARGGVGRVLRHRRGAHERRQARPGARRRGSCIRRAGPRLVVEVSDDGPGGADPRGGGLSGLRQRVEALDGTLDVDSPEGVGTTIRAGLPCES